MAESRGSFQETVERIDALKGRNGNDTWVSTREASLLDYLGRAAEALRLYRILAEANPGSWQLRGLFKYRGRHLAESLMELYQNSPEQLTQKRKWDEIRRNLGAINTRPYLAMIQANANGETLIPLENNRQSSLWLEIDRHLLSLKPEILQPLRKQQEEEATEFIEFPSSDSDVRDSVHLFRRFPLSTTAHRRLLRTAQSELLQSRPGLALRSFRDLIDHTSDVELRKAAQVGLWMALAESCNQEAFETSFNQTPAGTTYPWKGKLLSAEAIRKSLRTKFGEIGEAISRETLAKLSSRVLKVPPASVWPLEAYELVKLRLLTRFGSMKGRIQISGKGVLVSGPNGLSWFEGDGNTPKWSRTESFLPGITRYRKDQGLAISLPGLFEPVIHEGRIYTRWGLDSSRRRMTGAACFDTASGRLIWSTLGKISWSGLNPASDPVLADGRLYLLAVKQGMISTTSEISLVCLNTDDGSMLWRKNFGSQKLTMTPTWNSGYPYYRFDFVHFGNAVTVRDGHVYCLTNMGLVARCDARDGMVEWVHPYPRCWLGYNLLHLLARMGSPPIIDGERIVILPRDTFGVFALNRNTGEQVWDNAYVPSEAVAGRFGDLLLLRNKREVAGISMKTGGVVWFRQFDGTLLESPAQTGPVLTVATAEKLYRLESASGRTLETSDWKTKPLSPFSLRGSELLGLSSEPSGILEGRKSAIKIAAKPAPKSFKLPVAEAWNLERPNPRIWAPPASMNKNKFIVLSQGILECVKTDPTGQITWRRVIPPGLQKLAWHGEVVFLIFAQRIQVLSDSGGQLKWEITTSYPIRQWKVFTPYLVLADYNLESPGRNTSVLDLETGRLLWHREFGEEVHRPSLVHIGWEEGKLHLLGLSKNGYELDVICRPKDGLVVKMDIENPAAAAAALVTTADEDLDIDFEEEVAEEALPVLFRLLYTDDMTIDAATDSQFFGLKNILNFSVHGQWIRCRLKNAPKRSSSKYFILNRQDAGYKMPITHTAVIRGDRLYDFSGRSLSVVDLNTQRRIAEYRVRPSEASRSVWVVDFWEEEDSIAVVSQEKMKYLPERLRIDVFEQKREMLRNSQNLPRHSLWSITKSYGNSTTHTQVVARNGMVFITGAHGIQAFVSGVGGEETSPVYEIKPVEEPVVVDGFMNDWEPQFAVPMKGGDGTQANFYTAHDRDNLYLAIEYPGDSIKPAHGVGSFGGGNWIEFALRTISHQFRWGMGTDTAGRFIWRNFEESRIPPGSEAKLRHDFGNQKVVLECSVPINGILDRWRKDSDRIGISLTVWDEEPARGQVRRYKFGDGLRGYQVEPQRHEVFQLR